MLKVKTVTLEFLRLGPAHNQLLSPLTDYIGLCGNFGATAVNVSWEHAEFMRRLRTLRYAGGHDPRQRQAAIQEVGRETARILGSIPGLAAGHSRDAGSDSLTHLQIVVSAAELALLPFELSKVPAGCPGGAENWLSLQTSAPVCITRTVRSVADVRVDWPTKPRILLVAASPAGLTIPLEAHVQALLGAVQPWLRTFEHEKKEASRARRLKRESERLLTVLPAASAERIEAACAENEFTHVHILAHGMRNEKEDGGAFGLALHGGRDGSQIEVVSGSRLASALRPLRSSSAGKSLPCMVSVASCDSGNVGDVVYSGASLAHQLHQAEIPFVVASQFPLSFAGSVQMADVLYRRLLWGDDPREVLTDLRKKLFALHSADTHDWASLVAYAAFPDDLDAQLEETRYLQARWAMNAALSEADMELSRARWGKRRSGGGMGAFFGRADKAAERLPVRGIYETEVKGLKGSMHKRKAQLSYRDAHLKRGISKMRKLRDMLEELGRARNHYKSAVESELTQGGTSIKSSTLHWVATQYLSLRAILGEPLERRYWQIAVSIAETQIANDRAEERFWSHASLAELYLLRLAHPQRKGGRLSHQAARDKALEHARQLRELAAEGSFELFSTVRQFRRYETWWGQRDFTEFLQRRGVRRPSWRSLMATNRKIMAMLDRAHGRGRR